MGLFSWFSKKPEPDFELLLQQISSAILDKQQRLSEIKLRERRATLLFTLYAFGLWVLYAGLWWLDWLPLGLLAGLWRGEDEEGYEMDEDSVGWERGLAGVLLVGAPAVVGPFCIIFIRRIVKRWYLRQETFEEKELRELRVRQRAAIEDIKKKTNYYNTKNLLDRYDNGSAAAIKPTEPSGSLRKRAFQPPASPQSPTIRTTNHSSAAQNSPSPANDPRSRNLSSSTSSSLSHAVATPPSSRQQQLLLNQQTPIQTPGGIDPNSPLFHPTPVHPPTPPVKQWYDRLADAVLGEDPSSTAARNGAGGGGADMGKMALVCEKCFAWNGLVEEKRWGDMQYRCPKCDHFNPSPNSRIAAPRSQPPHPSDPNVSGGLTSSTSTPNRLLHRPSSGGSSSLAASSSMPHQLSRSYSGPGSSSDEDGAGNEDVSMTDAAGVEEKEEEKEKEKEEVASGGKEKETPSKKGKKGKGKK